ncbi:hypothetical protein AVEN_195490-1 [Araneus ventricosus]|uniref:Uncharacterized protein n=1 Tax=Araneus ventricosus TaxID=182803 RepID=A0A4Y2K4J5_ARAVE|nr:hypothetical protein AVEN_195490-1 [Araneus ventricosus]
MQSQKVACSIQIRFPIHYKIFSKHNVLEEETVKVRKKSKLLKPVDISVNFEKQHEIVPMMSHANINPTWGHHEYVDMRSRRRSKRVLAPGVGTVMRGIESSLQ